MAEKDTIMMNRKEARRLHIIHQSLDEKVTQAEAAPLIGLTDRQIRRLIKRVRIEDDEGIKPRSRKSWVEPTIEEQLNDQKPMSHFEKSLAKLEVDVIHANSPQAKGRVERLFKTLQDRLTNCP